MLQQRKRAFLLLLLISPSLSLSYRSFVWSGKNIATIPIWSKAGEADVQGSERGFDVFGGRGGVGHYLVDGGAISQAKRGSGGQGGSISTQFVKAAKNRRIIDTITLFKNLFFSVLFL
jgi:hypothetical protein